MTAAADDSAGGDTDMRSEAPASGAYSLLVASDGTFSDTGWAEARHVGTNTASSLNFATISIGDAVATWADGRVRIPVAVSGNRSANFSVAWAAAEGSARLGVDYTLASGFLQWTNTSQGTKYIEIPLDATVAAASNRTFTVELTAVYGGVLADSEATITLYGSGSAPGSGESGMGESEWSTPVPVDARAANGPILWSADATPVAYDSAWAGDGVARVRVTGETPDGTASVLLDAAAPVRGTREWTPGLATGAYHLEHASLNAEGTSLRTLEATLIRLDDSTQLHSALEGTEVVWSNGMVHVVAGIVTVPSGTTLTIQPGAIVKFQTGAGLLVASGGACVANGVIFTHIADDTAGGDTLFDGDASFPVADVYSLSGTLTTDSDTELRYLTVRTSGTLSGNTVWMGHRVYRVTGNLTIPSGATLTIQPGAIVKFDAGLSLTVNSGGTLNAIGQRAAPIVFTSIKDDEHGGDTNGDGNGSAPQPGDWARVSVAGTANFEWCRVAYNSPTSDQGGIQGTSSGKVLFNNSIIEHTVYECVRMNSSSTFAATNSIFRDSSMGFGYYGGSGVRVVNCIVADVTVGCRARNKTFINTVFYNNVSFTDQGGDSSTFQYCTFFNPSGYGAQSYTKVGTSGNVWGDPQFVDAANGDYRVRAGSPCIDAGDGTVAPERDYYGQPRMNDPNVVDTGVANTNGVCPDIGIYEMEGGNAASDVDLTAVRVSAPAEAAVGGPMEVRWQVSNIGTEKAGGPWRDVVSLVSANGGTAMELGESLVSGGLATKATRECSAVFTVPPMEEGSWFVQVRVNAYRDVFEGALVTNNLRTAAAATAISVPALAAGGATNGAATAEAPFTAKIAAPTNGTYAARIEAPAGAVVLYGVGFVPSATSYSGRLVCGTHGALVSLPAGATVYVVVLGSSASAQAVTVNVLDAALLLNSVSPASLPSSGMTTLTLLGANFATNAAVRIGAIAAESVEWKSAEMLVATIDCSKLAPGAASAVSVVSGGETATLAGAVTVQAQQGRAELTAGIEVPDSVRQGRSMAIYVDYENTGNLDLPAPVLEVVATGVVFTVDGIDYTNRVSVMGLSEEAPVGTLRPGEPQRLALTARLTTSASNVRYTLHSRHAAQEAAQQAVRLGTFFNPAWLYRAKTNESAMVAALQETIGATWADFYFGMGPFASTQFESNENIVTYDSLSTAFVESVYWNLFAPEIPEDAEIDDSDDGSVPDEVLSGAAARSGATVLSGTSYGKDHSIDGDIWCWNGSGWTLLFSDQADVEINDVQTRRTGLVTVAGGSSSASSVFNPDRESVLICHGMRNSIHQSWIESMARKLKTKHKGTRNILAVDWGEGATKLLPHVAAWSIDDAARVAHAHLADAGVSGAELTLIGHSHGGHFAGYLASQFGGVDRLIGLDVSTADLLVHGFDGDDFWKDARARQKLFYKSSWNLSLASDSHSEMDADFNFVVMRDGDFYEENFLSTHEQNDRHSHAYEWFTKTIVPNSTVNDGYNWTDTSSSHPQWTAKTKLTTHPGRHAFAAVIHTTHNSLECAVPPNGTVISDWKYDVLCLGQRNMDDFHENMLRVVDYMAVGLTVQSTTETGTRNNELLTGGRAGNQVKLSYKNHANADNHSIPWNHLDRLNRWKPSEENNDKYLPWNGWNAMENSLWLIRTNGLANSATVVTALRQGGVPTAALGAQLWNASYREKIGRIEASEKDFAKPGITRESTFADISIKPDLFSPGRRLGCDEDGNPLEDGETCILLGLAAENDDDGMVYVYDLSPATNNYFAMAVQIYDGELGIPIIRKADGQRTSARTDSMRANDEDDGLSEVFIDIMANTNGAWEVRLDGSRSVFPYGSTAQYVWYDGSMNELSRSARITFYGDLPEDADYGEATVYLKVAPDVAAAKLAECTLRITREIPEPEPEPEDGEGSSVPQSCDPNEMSGPDGVRLVEEGSTNRYVKAGRWMDYTVFFENKSDATAAAQEVYVSNPLSPYLDWTTFQMKEIAFHNQTDLGLGGRQGGSSEVAMADTNLPYSVRTTLSISTNGVVNWYLRVVDSTTEDGWPVDVYAGFLPPNDATGCGEGHLSYRVKVREDAPLGAVITNSASIVFDDNDPIETDPAWWNIVETIVTVDFGGGSDGAGVLAAGEDAGDFVAGKTYGELPEPTRSGYVFAGWWTGAVTAVAGDYAAGIGSGIYEETGAVQIESGTLTALGGVFGAGIGGGLVSPGGQVVVSGGSVKARGNRGMDIGSGFGESAAGTLTDGRGNEVFEVEIPLATDATPVSVSVPVAAGAAYLYEGSGHAEDSSLYFYLPAGVFEFEADGDDYGANVEDAPAEAVFTDPGNANFVEPPLDFAAPEGTNRARLRLNAAYRTSPFEVWTATALSGTAWNWALLPAAEYRYVQSNATVELPELTNSLRLYHFRFLPR